LIEKKQFDTMGTEKTTCMNYTNLTLYL